MLACLQRQNQPAQHQHQHLTCAAKSLDAPLNRRSEVISTRYPSTAELDSYAQRTADSPLSIKIFPSNIRVPQHKQISRTVNGLDTAGQGLGPYSHPSQGLLAIIKTSSKGVLKSADGKRAKLSPIQMAVAPYAPPSGSRHRQRPYSVVSHGVVHHMSHASNVQSTPSFLDTSFAQSALAYSGAVLPTQSADYWAQRHYPHMYGSGSGAVVSRSPEASYRSHPPSLTILDKVPSSPAMHGDFSVSQFFAPAWNSVLATPDSDCYSLQDLPAGSTMAPRLHPHTQQPAPYLCCGPQGKSLSSSLQSLECLISEIHPPCIKERMLGRGYDPHLQQPVLR
ncbi:protein FAM222A-like [Sinocyclocheilus grahami]|uniref:Family with sequence similarity 222 member A n=1 Tax=Sinocyclocheilus grahami TaxID=75366 RepID=A0A672LAU6_SINGR|nr:PREDICTED: protein FAM222A-like [Sinocyclocheilus grahami]